MFYGTYEHSLDEKGRLIIPAKFREALRDSLADSFMMAPGLEQCIFMFPLSEWRTLEEKLKKLPFMSGTDARGFTRHLFAGAAPCNMDEQGRILIPTYLRQHAGIDRDVVITGVGNHVEIWSKSRWKTYLGKQAKSFEKTAERLMSFGI